MNATQRAACVIGWPAKHSRSPKLHGYWIRKYGLDADYRIEEQPAEAFTEFVTNLAARGYVGANVTMPHKEAALALAQPDARARAVGAANTLWLDGGVLRATNTDVEGFVGALDAAAPGWHAPGSRAPGSRAPGSRAPGSRERIDAAVVLGAGGAARAVVYGLLERGLKTVHVVNRSLDKAQALRDRFGSAVQPAPWSARDELLRGARLLVNATALGMHGQPPLDIDLAPLAADAIVADIVYVPLKTRLLAQAERRGLVTSNGLDMLLHQAVRGFELWFGVRPEVTRELFDLLAADIPA